jgi:hypothetical protein
MIIALPKLPCHLILQSGQQMNIHFSQAASLIFEDQQRSLHLISSQASQQSRIQALKHRDSLGLR